jgi:hypothetical protein
MSADPRLVRHALALLRGEPVYREDARRFARVGNSIVGSVMSLTLGAPRWATEAAVVEAVRQLGRSAGRDEDKA